jgi:hypothetical protein
MRVLLRRMIVALVAAGLLLGSASPASADSAELVAEGALTLRTTPPLEFPIGEGDPHPCRDPEQFFTASTSGGATTGEVDVSLPSLFVPKPGSNPVAHDEVRFSVLWDDLEYSRVGSTFDYDLSGTVVLSLEAWNIDQETCAKTNAKCSFVLQLDVAGSQVQNGQLLPTIGTGATVTLVATTIFPLTYVEGDCDEYYILDGVHVDLDLFLTRI